MKEKEEFTTEIYENITFSVSKDRKTLFIMVYDRLELVEFELSSLAAYMLCKSIVDLLEKEESAYDLMGQKVLIPIGKRIAK